MCPIVNSNKMCDHGRLTGMALFAGPRCKHSSTPRVMLNILLLSCFKYKPEQKWALKSSVKCNLWLMFGLCFTELSTRAVLRRRTSSSTGLLCTVTPSSPWWPFWGPCLILVSASATMRERWVVTHCLQWSTVLLFAGGPGVSETCLIYLHYVDSL